MNPQELFIDVSSGRFLDGNSTIPLSKPTIYSDEKRRLRLTVNKVRNNVLSPVTPSPESSYKLRIGTPTLKLADGVDVTTVPPVLITALATVSTSPSKQTIGTSSIYTYTPVTAQFVAILENRTVTRPQLKAEIATFTETVASISVSIGSVTPPAETARVNLEKIFTNINNFQAEMPVNFAVDFEASAAATFLATVSGGTVTTISILSDGEGYPNGNYSLTFSGGSPSVTASATAVALNGEIQSVTIDSGGSGYSSAPAVSLFTPDKSFLRIRPISRSWRDDSLNRVRFSGGLPSSLTIGTPIPFLIPPPDTTSSVTAKITATATLTEETAGNWVIQITTKGYGYVATPTVSHSDYAVLLPATSYTFEDGSFIKTTRTFKGLFSQGGIRLKELSFNPNPAILFDNYKNQKNRVFKTEKTLVTYGYPTVHDVSNAWGLVPKPPLLIGGAAFRSGNGYYQGPFFFDEKTNKAISFSSRESEIQVGEYLSSSAIQQDESIAGKTFYFTFSGNAQRNALIAIRIPPIRNDYKFVQKGFLFPTSSQPLFSDEITYSGGGVFEPTIQILDYGAGYAANPGNLTYIGGLEQVQSFYSSKYDRTPVFLSPINTILSTTASAVKSNTSGIFEYSINNGGFGYSESQNITFTGGAILGGVVSASLTNNPKGYLVGSYPFSVQAPSGGTVASISLNVADPGSDGAGANFSISILNSGEGYTSTPAITAPEINFRSGYLSNVVIENQQFNPFAGYQDSTGYWVIRPIASASPVTGGDAEIIMTLPPFGSRGIGGQHIVKINKKGFGYITAPTFTVPTPPIPSGRVSQIYLNPNSPAAVGYTPGKSYDLIVGQSPVSGGTPLAKMIVGNGYIYAQLVDSDGNYIGDSGFGYTTAPIVTAPAPDLPNGFITGVAVSSKGIGYAPGSYQCLVDAPASTAGQVANINLIVDDNLNQSFQITEAGSGYTAAPKIAAVTPAGNIISGITITCQGTYYTKTTATFTIDDTYGAGAIFESPIVVNGKVLGINILNGGYGFLDNPKITFSAPTQPDEFVINQNQVEADFTITAASANAILTTANQRDVLLEVYETDGTNEQVVVQGVVNLTKRVLE